MGIAEKYQDIGQSLEQLGQLGKAKGDTVFNFNFNFERNEDQKNNLKELIDGNFTLCAYKGAKGSGAIPVWFTETYDNVFGILSVNYTPSYKVFIGALREVSGTTSLNVSKSSAEIGLGKGLAVDKYGNFSTLANKDPLSIALMNNRPNGTPPLTVGLSALVGGEYKPFCTFELKPGGTINMEPLETVLLFAAQTDLVSGSVNATTAAPGCTFPFGQGPTTFPLEIGRAHV